MNFKLMMRPRPLYVGIALTSPFTTIGDQTISGWKLPYQGIWNVAAIGGGGGSGAYNGSHSTSSEAGYNGNTLNSTVYRAPEDTGTVTLGGGGVKGDIVGITYNNGGNGGNTLITGLVAGGGIGGIASNGTPLTSTRPAPSWINYTSANYAYFFGTNYSDSSTGGTNTGKGADGVNGFFTNQWGLDGYRGGIVVTCVG